MPQLVKGGKYTFGWSRVGDTGRIVIPAEAVEEYRLKESEKLILVPGSKTSRRQEGLDWLLKSLLKVLPWEVW